MKKRIGIMGGTFDPIHNAHLALGRQALLQKDLDEIWFMPDKTPPHKRDRKVTDALHRCRMTELAVAGQKGFVCSLFEQTREGFTYTADTLEALGRAYPQEQFYFMIGADSLYEIESWHDPARVMRLTTLLVAARDYAKAQQPLHAQAAMLQKKYGAAIEFLHCPEMPVSATEIRALCAAGKDISAYVPKPVAAYIQTHHLYE